MTSAHALERLYAVAPRDFTRARNALAAELRASHDPGAAREVARLRRPSAALWAVNQLARHARPALERFLEAVDRLRRAQLSDPRGAMEAMRAERAQLEALVAQAETALQEAGYAPSAEMRRRISDTLLGAAADRRHAEALKHGRLSEELHAPGFDALTGATQLRVVQGGAPRRPDAAAAKARDDRRRGAAEARAQERDAKTRRIVSQSWRILSPRLEGWGAASGAGFGAVAAAGAGGAACVTGPGSTVSPTGGDALSDGGSGAGTRRTGGRDAGRTTGSRTGASAGRVATGRSTCLPRTPACATSSLSRLRPASTRATRPSA